MSSNDSVIAYLHRHAKPVSLRDVDHNYTIITPHAALARRTLYQWQSFQTTACLAPECLSLTQWLQQTYQLSAQCDKLILNYWQQLQLWMQVISHNQGIDFNPNDFYLAKTYQQHWQEFKLTQLYTGLDQDFITQAQNYIDLCESYACVDPLALLDDISYWHSNKHPIVLHGFGWLSTGLQKLVTSITQEHLYYLEACNHSTKVLCYDTVAQEMLATSQSIAQIQASQPQATHAVVLSEQQYYQPMLNMLNQVCFTDSFHIQQYQPGPIDCSVNPLLIDHAIVLACTTLMEYIQKPDGHSFIKVFANNYFQHPDVHRAFYDRIQAITLPWQCTVSLAVSIISQYCQDDIYWEHFSTSLHYLADLQIPEKQEYSQWATWSLDLLASMLIARLNPHEQLSYEQIQNAILFVDPYFTGYTENISFPVWFTLLQNYFSITPSQISFTEGNIYLGLWTDSIAMPCDYLWTIGTHASVWPGQAPGQHQPAQVVQSWQHIISYHQQFAKFSTISYARIDAQDQDLLPSPLHSDTIVVQRNTAAEHPLVAPCACVTDKLNVCGPELSATEKTIASSVLKQYSQCPAKGFISARLLVAPKEPKQIGFSAADIGILVHASLQKWFHPSIAADPSQINQWIIDYTHKQRWAWGPTKVQKDTVAAHISDVVCHWLSTCIADHQSESNFSWRNEVAIEYSLGPVHLRLRADRIDYFNDNTCRIIDYKTSQASRNTWLAPRMDEPQLPLYALGCQQSSCISFASLHPMQWGYSGVCTSDSQLNGIVAMHKWHKDAADDWSAQLQQWQHDLETLALTYAAGSALVHPKNIQACQFCQFSNICRINDS